MADATSTTSSSRLLARRYELGALLGVGGMGQVWAGRDRILGRDVAIKVLRVDIADQPAARRRFQEEARLAARLAHPHVVPVFDAGEDDGIAFYVMERLSGRTLADEIAAGPLPPESVTTMGRQILTALAAAHAVGLVHRDVTPANIMVAMPGWWKLGDFGIAKVLELGDLRRTATGVLVGTPAYMAPERLAGEPATVSNDLYSTGIVLYEALTGRRRAVDGIPLSALVAITPSHVRELSPEIPAGLAEVVMRAVAPDPGGAVPFGRGHGFGAGRSADLVLRCDVDKRTGRPVTTFPCCPAPSRRTVNRPRGVASMCRGHRGVRRCTGPGPGVGHR